MVSSGGSGRLAAPVPQPSEVIDVDYIPPSSQNYKVSESGPQIYLIYYSD